MSKNEKDQQGQLTSAAEILGEKGGKSKSNKKKLSSKKNGKKGGRPKS